MLRRWGRRVWTLCDDVEAVLSAAVNFSPIGKKGLGAE